MIKLFFITSRVILGGYLETPIYYMKYRILRRIDLDKICVRMQFNLCDIPCFQDWLWQGTAKALAHFPTGARPSRGFPIL